MLDFPSAPTLGQKYPQPPQAGVPVYTWDGEKWTTIGGAVTTKTPIWSDGSQPMQGPLTLFTPPLNANDAVAKGYVDTRVRYDAPQGLTSPQQQQARKNIAAPYFDHVTVGGMQFNGLFAINQEFGVGGANFGCSAAGGSTCDNYIADGWKMVAGGGGAGASLINHTIGPHNIGGVVTSRALQIYIDNHDFYLDGATDHCVLRHFVEGYRMRHLGFGYSGARSLTVSFWYANDGGYSGPMGVTLRNINANRNCTGVVNIIPGAGWRFYSVTFPGDTTGTWNDTNGVGFYVDFCLCCHFNHMTTTPGVWGAAVKFGALNQAHFMRTGTANRFCGVMMLAGDEAPPPLSTIVNARSYEEEFAICQRHLHIVGSGDGITLFPRCDNDTYRTGGQDFQVQMRTAPTMTVAGILNYAGGQIAVSAGAGYHSWSGGITLNTPGETFVVQKVKADARI